MRSLTETARKIKDTDEPPWDYRRFELLFFSLENDCQVFV
jgi:hypothetical protein